MPIDRGIPFFKVIYVVFSFFMTSTLIFFMYKCVQGKFDEYNHKDPIEETFHINFFSVCGYIMMFNYFLPIFLRPVDFL
jgi:hypothetical protein